MIYQIAIDGPAGAGKSTIARKVANELNFDYIDTGAMYRAVTLKALELEIDLEDESQFDFLDTIKIDFKDNNIYLDNRDVSEEIRTLEVSNNVSQVAKLKIVREKLLLMQQELAKSKNVIMDGRDIGTVVLPNAHLKIFLNASIEERAKRRLSERKTTSDNNLSLEETIAEIKERDLKDSTREINPLKKAEDAVEIDTSTMSIEEVIDEIILLFTKRGYSMVNFEQNNSNQNVDQEQTDQTPETKEVLEEVVTEEKKEKVEVDAPTEVADEKTEEVKEGKVAEAKAENEDLDDDIADEDVHEEDDFSDVEEEEDEDEEPKHHEKAKGEVQVRPLQMVTGTVVRVFDPIEAQLDNFGNILRKSRDGRVLIDLDNGYEGLLFPRDIEGYEEGQDLHELFPVGMDLTLIIRRVYPDGGRVLLSTKLLKMREELSQFEEKLENPQIITAKVVKQISIGLLLKHGEYSCLLPTTQIVGEPETHADMVGTEIEVVPIRIDYNRIRLVVSQTVANGIRMTEKKEEYIKTLEVGQVFEGIVKNIERYGAFIELTPGVEGLLHISEIDHERVNKIEKYIKSGDTVKVQIINIDGDRIGLSRKALIPNLWKDVITSLNINDKVNVKVVEINKSGVVVEFPEGVNGFLPKSEFAWERDVYIEDYIELGDEMELMVIDLDLPKKRIILSRKQLHDNPWETINLKINQSIEVEVVKILNDGFKVNYKNIMGYLPNINVNEDTIKLKDITEGTKLEVRVRVFDQQRTRLIVTMIDREKFDKHQKSNYQRPKQEAFTSTFGDLIADSLKNK